MLWVRPSVGRRDDRAFAGWRVNYDTVLVSLAGLTMALYAPWSSDRSIPRYRPRMSQRVSRRRE